MKLEREVDDDTEVAAAPTQRPEQLRILDARRPHHRTVRGYDRGGKQVVERQPV
jgi:hypothetical protein